MTGEMKGRKFFPRQESNPRLVYEVRIAHICRKNLSELGTENFSSSARIWTRILWMKFQPPNRHIKPAQVLTIISACSPDLLTTYHFFQFIFFYNKK